MTQEEIELLFQDLCARLPYGVKVTFAGYSGRDDCTLHSQHLNSTYSIEYLGLKPYLRPLSSMTEEEKKELKFMCDIGPETLTDSSWINGEFGLSVVYKNKASICIDAIDWLNKNMFDFRGLIDKGLALSTEEYNPYKDNLI